MFSILSERNVYCPFLNAKIYYFHVFIFESCQFNSIENEHFQTIFFKKLKYASNFVFRRTIIENVTTVDLEITFNTTSLSSIDLLPENDTDPDLFYNLNVVSVSEFSMSMYIVGQLY